MTTVADARKSVRCDRRESTIIFHGGSKLEYHTKRPACEGPGWLSASHTAVVSGGGQFAVYGVCHT
jgi:hypothetical protein